MSNCKLQQKSLHLSISIPKMYCSHKLKSKSPIIKSWLYVNWFWTNDQFDMIIDYWWKLMPFLFSGEVQPAVSPNPRTEVNRARNPKIYLFWKIWIEMICYQVDGATRGGLPVFQAHAGERPPRHTPHGDAACKKEIVITREWVGWTTRLHAEFQVWPLQFASDSGWGAWKDWVKKARRASSIFRHLVLRPFLPSLPSSCSYSHMFASCARVQIRVQYLNIFLHTSHLFAYTSTTCWNGAGGKKCVHSVEKEKEGRMEPVQ